MTSSEKPPIALVAALDEAGVIGYEAVCLAPAGRYALVPRKDDGQAGHYGAPDV